MIKRLIILVIAMAPFAVKAQSAYDFFSFGILDTTVRWPEVIKTYGLAESADTASFGRWIDYEYKPYGSIDGHIYFSFNRKGNLTGFHVYTSGFYSGTKEIVEKWLKTKFNMDNDLASLFYLDEKELKAKLESMGIAMEKPDKGKYYTKYRLLNKADNKLFSNIGVTLYVGTGKIDQKGKVCQIEVNYFVY